jgi:hypothetical protein
MVRLLHKEESEVDFSDCSEHSDNLDYYHNKGQSDAADGDYDPPHGGLDDLVTWSDHGMSKNACENHAYDLGYFHTRGQIDQVANEYDPPSSTYLHKSAYFGLGAVG